MDDRGALGRAGSARVLCRWLDLSALEQSTTNARLRVEAIGPRRRHLDAQGLAEAALQWATTWTPRDSVFVEPGAVAVDRLASNAIQRLLLSELVNACAAGLVEGAE